MSAPALVRFLKGFLGAFVLPVDAPHAQTFAKASDAAPQRKRRERQTVDRDDESMAPAAGR